MIENLLKKNKYSELQELIEGNPSIVIEPIETGDKQRSKNYTYLPQLIIQEIKIDHSGRGLKQKIVDRNQALMNLYILVARLLDDIDHNFGLSGTLFQMALSARSSYLLQELVNLGASVDVKAPNCSKAFHWNGNTYEIAEVFINAGVDPEISNDNGETLLHLNLESVEITRLLLRCGVDVNCRDNDGYTPVLRHAERSTLSTHSKLVKRKSVITCLAENGANLNLKNNDGEDLFHLLAKNPDCSDLFPVFHEFIDYSVIDKSRALEIAKDFISFGRLNELSVCIANMEIGERDEIESLIADICDPSKGDWCANDKMQLVAAIIEKFDGSINLADFAYRCISNNNDADMLRLANKSEIFEAVNRIEAPDDDFDAAKSVLLDVASNAPLDCVYSLSDLLEIYVDSCGAKTIDVEALEGGGAYRALLEDVLSLAPDIADFTIDEHNVDDGVILGITTGGTCKQVFLSKDGYVDSAFYEFLYDVSKESLKYRFYTLPAEDQSTWVVYMPQKLIDIFVKNKVLV